MFSLDVPPPGWVPPQDMPGLPFVGCGELGFGWIGVASESVEIVPIVHPERDVPGNRFNDGKFGPDGRYWAGTMHVAEERATGSLYTFGPVGDYAVMDRGYRVANGPAFSPDGSVVYHSDSARREVYAFDRTSDGSLIDKRLFVRFRAGRECPDGMTTDREGNLWIAIWGGSRVEKRSPEGLLVDVIPMPTPRPTSCAFAGPERSDLFVTSASIGVVEDDPVAGGLFRVRLGAGER